MACQDLENVTCKQVNIRYKKLKIELDLVYSFLFYTILILFVLLK